MKTAGQMVRDYRKKHGLTQTFVGKCVGVNPKMMSVYEIGSTRMPADVFLKIIVDGFGTTPQNFFAEQFPENDQYSKD